MVTTDISLDIARLTRRRGPVTVVDGLTFRAEPGRVTGFLGPNGAGKSTTLRTVLGLERADAGTALFGGVPYASLPRPLRTVGALLEARSAHPGRTGRAHLRFLARTHRIPDSRVDAVLDQVGLTDAAGKRTGTYSLGMGQRLGIAAALLGDPPVLLLDEPVNGLDPEGIVRLRGLMRRWAAEGRTVLVSSHLMGEAALTVDDVVVVARGRLVARGPVGEVVRAHAGPGGSLEEAFIRLTAGASAGTGAGR
ncbi:ATP-binding cassette domain-containing protein [Streptomyces sp. NPDC006798]|uniref:ABC transporter ATP-binding protein n=1 Tax=Streptomyces sp. NPDC006798 TaxID=3155462 RepID=UPI00340E9AA6